MEAVSRVALIVSLCVMIILLLLIATVTEDAATKLLRELQINKRLTSNERNMLRPIVNCLNYGTRRALDTSNLEKRKKLLRSLLLDCRISCSEFEAIVSSDKEGIMPSWRAKAKDSFVTWYRSRRNPFKVSAAQRTLGTPELVERILVYVPYQDLARDVPRTSKIFRDVTRTSPNVRRRLFLDPDRKCFPQVELPLKLMGVSLHFVRRYSVRERFVGGGLVRESFDAEGFGILARFPNTSLDRIQVKRLRAYRALQDTLIAQPPIQHIEVRLSGSHFESKERACVHSSAECGVTVGAVLAKLESLFDEMADDVFWGSDVGSHSVHLSRLEECSCGAMHATDNVG